MKNVIVSYKVNKFIPYIVFRSIFLCILIYAALKGKVLINPILAYSIVSLISLIIIKDILLLLFETIQLVRLEKKILVEKRILGAKFSTKEINKPFDIEIVYNIKSNYNLGSSNQDWLRFYHKKGLRFFKKDGEMIYEIGLNDKIDAKQIFDKIN